MRIMTTSYHYNKSLFVRPPEEGMGLAVARRTVFRKRCACGAEPWASEERCPKCAAALDESTCENWGDVATRVATGNALIHPSGARDLLDLERHIASGALLTSGRHLQHGDRTQPGRTINVFSNCSTAATSAEKFYLLLSGSGVGRCYDDDVMLVDWRRMPEVHCVLSHKHPDHDFDICDSPDFATSHGMFVTAAGRKEGVLIEFDLSCGSDLGKDYYYFVEDSREGWARAVELLEGMTYEGWSCRKLVLDFSFVRAKGRPIVGMQHRPSAGPVPTIKAIQSICRMVERARTEGWPEWKQTLYVDHYLADCVHLGGARRAARISIKHWRDPGIMEYCRIKQAGGLWTANMSVGLDEEFYDQLAAGDEWARLVADAIVDGQYVDLTGEPGSINQHRLHARADGVAEMSARLGGNYPKLTSMMRRLREDLHQRLVAKKWIFITNPCQPGFATVLTPEGVKTFDDIDVGSTIWSGKQWTKVTAKVATGVKPVLAYSTMAGVFVGTSNHRVIANGERCEVGKTRVIDKCPHPPGLIDAPWLSQNKYYGSGRYNDIDNTTALGTYPVYDITVEADEHTYWTGGLLVSNCSEISLLITGGYCIVMDVAPCNIQKLDEYYNYRGRDLWGSNYVEDLGYDIQAEFESVVRHAARACIRTNLLPAHFQGEVDRTNRIGISLAGIHEYAWKRFGLTFRDLLDEDRSYEFWESLAAARRALHDECVRYSREIGVTPPHTESAFKPGGSVPKIHGLSECANLPSLPYMIRWVQFAKGDPRVAEYEAAGYPVKRDVRSYEMSEIVGFPTQMPIAELMGDKLVTAGDATPEEHYQWLRLLEKYWIVGVELDGTPMEDRGNQVAYTLKFDPKKVSRQEWFETWRRNQASVRCCAVMPQVDVTAYAYQPEEAITKEVYEQMTDRIRRATEVFDPDTSSCTMGACPL